MEINIIDKDTYELLELKLNQVVKSSYGNDYVVAINSVTVDYDLDNFVTMKLGWGKEDGTTWKTGSIDFTQPIELQRLLGLFEALCVQVDESE